MKKQCAVRLEESVEAGIKELGGGSLVKGIEYLYTNYQKSDGIHCIPDEEMEYKDMKNIYIEMGNFLKKYKPVAPTDDGIQDGIQMSKIDKLKQIANGKYNTDEVRSEPTPNQRTILNDIKEKTKRGKFWEEGDELTKEELLRRKGLLHFIDLI